MKNNQFIPPLTDHKQSGVCQTCWAFEEIELKKQTILKKEMKQEDKALYGAELQTYYFYFSQRYNYAV